MKVKIEPRRTAYSFIYRARLSSLEKRGIRERANWRRTPRKRGRMEGNEGATGEERKTGLPGFLFSSCTRTSLIRSTPPLIPKFTFSLCLLLRRSPPTRFRPHPSFARRFTRSRWRTPRLIIFFFSTRIFFNQV